MCLAIPGKVKSLCGKKVLVQYPQTETEVLTGGFNLKTGDNVLVQMGVVVQKLSPKESASILSLWQQLSS